MLKSNIAEVLEAEISKPQARHFRVFMSSATDPYQPAEARACLSQQCLTVFQQWCVEWLVLQTRSLLVRRDLPLLAQLPFVTLNMSIETDLVSVHQRFTHSSAEPERRLHLVHDAIEKGIMSQITVSPMLPHSPAFAERLAWAVGNRGRVIVDTFIDGDGSGGQRSARLGMSRVLAETGFPGWFERCRDHAQDLRARLTTLLGPKRVLWSAQGFANNPLGNDALKIR
jgi:DNA repair photolyase